MISVVSDLRTRGTVEVPTTGDHLLKSLLVMPGMLLLPVEMMLGTLPLSKSNTGP